MNNVNKYKAAIFGQQRYGLLICKLLLPQAKINLTRWKLT